MHSLVPVVLWSSSIEIGEVCGILVPVTLTLSICSFFEKLFAYKSLDVFKRVLVKLEQRYVGGSQMFEEAAYRFIAVIKGMDF